MSYYEHAVLIAMRLGPWSERPGPPFDIPARAKRHGSGSNAAGRRGRWRSLVRRLKSRLARRSG